MRGVLGLSSSLTFLTRQSSVAQSTATSHLLHRRFYPTPTQNTSPTRTTVTSSASISSMAASKARVPPALQAPTPPITKVLFPLYMRAREREFAYLIVVLFNLGRGFCFFLLLVFCVRIFLWSA